MAHIHTSPARTTWLTIGVGLIALAVLGAVSGYRPQVLGLSDERWPNRHTNASYHAYRGKPQRPELGQPQNIPLLLLTGDCDGDSPRQVSRDTTHLQIRLNEAFLVPSIQDLPVEPLQNARKANNLSQSYDHFLVVQGWVRSNLLPDASTKNKQNSFYPAWYMKLKNGPTTYEPITYGENSVMDMAYGTFWAVFPVRAEDTQFTLDYCPVAKPQSIPLDFTSGKVQNVRGNYSIDFGLFLRK